MRSPEPTRSFLARGLPLVLVATLGTLPLLTSCGASAPREGVVVRTGGLSTALEAGMAIAPLVAIDERQRDEAVAARMTEELYATLFASAGTALLIPPEDVVGVLGAGGPANREFFETFRARLARGDRPEDEDFVRLSRIVQHRFLLVGWYDEGTSEGVETGAGDYREPGFAEGVTNTRFAQVVGRVEAMILDLWEAEIVWHGVEAYRTDRIYAGGADAASSQTELDRARVDAAARIAVLLERSRG